MSAMPSKERHPGLYLAQNLKGNMDLLIAGEVPRATSRFHQGIDEAFRELERDGILDGELPMLAIPER